jgi:hypothetical protein
MAGHTHTVLFALFIKALGGTTADGTEGVFADQLEEYRATISGATGRVDVRAGRSRRDGAIHESIEGLGPRRITTSG